MEDDISNQNNKDETNTPVTDTSKSEDLAIANTKPLDAGSGTKKHKLKKIGLIILGIAVLTGGAYFAYTKYEDSKPEVKTETNIFIGDITITQDDIDRYARSVDNYKTQHPEIVIEGESKQIAIDDLVMNAALIKEAKDRNKSLTEEEYKSAFGTSEISPGFKEYIESIKAGDTATYYEVITKENIAHKKKLKPELVSNRALFYVQISFDAPFFRAQANQEELSKVHQQAKNDLTTKFLPLFEAKAKTEDIAKVADVNYYDDQSDAGTEKLFFDQVTSTSELIERYSSELEDTKNIDPSEIAKPEDILETFTDKENVDYGIAVEDLKNTAEELDKLQNAGDHTGVFASKTGTYMIARLESKSGGEYSTWKAFLNKYKNEYVPDEQLTYSPAVVDSVKNFATKTANDTASKLLSIGGEKASAVVCSQHYATMQVVMVDTATLSQVNGGVRISQPSGTCAGCSASGTGSASCRGTCYGSQPSSSHTSIPNGYAYDHTVYSAWTPSNINSRGYYQVYIHVRRTVQPITINGNSRLVKASDGSLIGAQGSPNYSEAHAIALDAGYFSNYQSTVSGQWSVNPDLTFRVCAIGPDWVQGSVRYTRSGARQQCQNVSNGNGRNVSFTFTYTEPAPPPPPPPANPVCEEFRNNGSNSISWITRNATSISINQGIGSVTPVANGSRGVSPTTTTTYTATVSGASGTTAVNCSTTITINTTPPPTCRLTGNDSTGPITISQDSSFTLRWSTTNSPATLIIRPDLPVNTPTSPPGQVDLSPSATTTYSGYLNGSSTASCQLVVNVTPLPRCTFTSPINPTTIRAGDSVTLTWSSTNASSVSTTNIPWVGDLPTTGTTSDVPDGSGAYSITVTNSAGATYTCTVTVNVSNDQPYFKITGNDAIAGSIFDDDGVEDGACSGGSTDATFKGFNLGGPTYGGAGAQFALLALGQITGVPSANLRTPITNPKSETFANSEANTYGGNFSTAGRCMPNYYGKHPEAPAPLGDGYRIDPPFAPLGANEQRVVYVDGDVYINTDITYDVKAGEKKSYTLIARGDIYIDNDVDQLDGIYIAQNKTDGSGGVIYTCALDLRVLPNATTNELHASCNNKLTTNGALIASLIKPWRTNGSLLSPDVPGNVAEEFNFSPELYLEPIKFGGSERTRTYDSITNTAPVF